MTPLASALLSRTDHVGIRVLRCSRPGQAFSRDRAPGFRRGGTPSGARSASAPARSALRPRRDADRQHADAGRDRGRGDGAGLRDARDPGAGALPGDLRPPVHQPAGGDLPRRLAERGGFRDVRITEAGALQPHPDAGRDAADAGRASRGRRAHRCVVQQRRGERRRLRARVGLRVRSDAGVRGRAGQGAAPLRRRVALLRDRSAGDAVRGRLPSRRRDRRAGRGSVRRGGDDLLARAVHAPLPAGPGGAPLRRAPRAVR